MATTNIPPSFKDQDEKNIVAGTIGVSLLLGLTGYLAVVPPLVVYFGMADKLSKNGKEIIRAFANFEIIICIVAFILLFTGIGVLLVPLVAIFGLVYCILALLAVLNNTEVKIPVFFEFIKESAGAPVNPAPTVNNDTTNNNPNP